MGCQVGGPSRDTGLKLCKEAPKFIKAFLLSGILTLHSMLSLPFTYFRPDTVTLILSHECKIKKYVGAFMVYVFYFSVLLATSLARRKLVEQLCKKFKASEQNELQYCHHKEIIILHTITKYHILYMIYMETQKKRAII